MESKGEIYISEYNNIPVVSTFVDGKMEYISFVRDTDTGSIYIGRVDHVVKNIDAAFIKYDGENIGYLALKNICRVCVVNRDLNDDPKLKAGDEIIVQVASEPLKTKKTKLTTDFSVSGKYAVITLGKKGVGASLKLKNEARSRLISLIKEELGDIFAQYPEVTGKTDLGVIIRTQALGLLDYPDDIIASEILNDIGALLKAIVHIFESAKTRTVGSLLYVKNGSDNNGLMDIYIAEAANNLKAFDIYDYKKVEDTGIFGISSKIDKLLSNKVWLKSGAYLIIEQLESFNAIDVNTGKAISGKSNIIEKINHEAAEEIMRQIRLRNLSGMILIDFINMPDKEMYEKLTEKIKTLCRLDPVHTNYVDITGLGIMELTRNKNGKSLKEIVTESQKNVDNRQD